MTLKASKYRIRRPLIRRKGGAAPAAEAAEAETPPATDGNAALAEETGAPPQEASPGAAAATPATDASGEDRARIEAELAAIRAEGLTGRQLRMARRVAQGHGLKPESDLDAVRLLRKRGIDPFQRANLLELVETGRETRPAVQEKSPLPAEKGKARLPSKDVYDDAARAKELIRIQRDLVRRRRRRLALLAVRLFFFIFLPTLIAGYYYYNVATPMYATQAEFVIQKADGPFGQSSGGGLLAGTSFATSQDAIAVQGYLQSRDAMLRLDREHGFKAAFQQPWIDPIQRLPAGASNEEAYRLYKRVVKIGFDPTEGVVKMEVIAPTPEAAVTFANALVGYAEEQVDQMTQRMREDQMRGARKAYEEAERKVREAQQRIIDLQEKRGVISGDLEVTTRMQQITTFELELKKKQLELEALRDNPRPNPTKVRVLERSIERLRKLIADMRNELTENGVDSASIARISSELAIARADLETRQALLSQALQQLETARLEANRQVRYLSLGVKPVKPDAAAYPRAFENTILAFLVFAGIYLVISLTISVLREQIAS